MFLAMDTVFEQCSIAILDANGQVLSSHTEQGKREQTQHILPMIDAPMIFLAWGFLAYKPLPSVRIKGMV